LGIEPSEANRKAIEWQLINRRSLKETVANTEMEVRAWREKFPHLTYANGTINED
jgi:hypothetical protein